MGFAVLILDGQRPSIERAVGLAPAHDRSSASAARG
jgi:hypothetical protein